jgi:hypothetical protein
VVDDNAVSEHPICAVVVVGEYLIELALVPREHGLRREGRGRVIARIWGHHPAHAVLKGCREPKEREVMG